MAMIRNEVERRNAEKDLAYLRAELEKRLSDDHDEGTREVAEALRIKASDVEANIREYDDLKAGRVSVVEAEDLDGLGELLVKARISKGWSQADLAKALEMEPQQVQRYERDDWQKASL
jgi:HTH-type transcriptional regulator/antitoxin HigA